LLYYRDELLQMSLTSEIDLNSTVGDNGQGFITPSHKAGCH